MSPISPGTPHLVCIDGMSWAFRCWHAMQGGHMQHGAAYGFFGMLLRTHEQLQPTHLLVAWDSPGPTTRAVAYPEYKAHRPPAPDGFGEALAAMMALADAMNAAQVAQRGVEADDIIATAARGALGLQPGAPADMHVTIQSSDRDLLQLVGERCTLLVPGKMGADVAWTPEHLQAEWGLRPEQIPDYKGLCGDASDNIPGVPGIGDKTATTLLQKYGTIDGVYAHLHEHTDKLRAKLEAGRDSAYLSRELATIAHVPGLPLGLDTLAVAAPNWPLLHEQLATYRFSSFGARLARLRGRLGAAQLPDAHTYEQEGLF